MFASHQVMLSMSFAQSRARLAVLGRGGRLSGPSAGAYAEGLDRLTGVGRCGAVLGGSRLVRVRLLEPVPRVDSLVLPLRWEATGAAGRLFPVLDADLTLSPGGQERSMLALTGAYRPPLGRADAALDRSWWGGMRLRQSGRCSPRSRRRWRRGEFSGPRGGGAGWPAARTLASGAGSFRLTPPDPRLTCGGTRA